MEYIGHLDFDLQIERAGEEYRVNVLASPAGQASSRFVLPFSDLELENFVLRMSRTRRQTRRVGTPELEAARAFGGRLYEAVFTGEVRGCLRSSLDAAAREGRGLRLRLRLTGAPELVDLPWEYLYNPALNRFFTLSTATPLVRYLELPEPVTPLSVQPPLRLLVVIASPRDFPALDVEQEWGKLRAALKELEEAGRITLERLEPPTLSALQRRLRAGPCHILHFIGHGAFDEATQDGQLLLEDREGRGHVISAQDLGVLLHDHQSMRLVMLNSCEGARASRTDPFAGAAQSLVQQGMPAVVAMQFEISDDAAIVIGHEFYNAVAAGYPVDAALAEARKAVFTTGSGAEWGTPVLYLRAPDGRIFGIAAPPAEPPQPIKPLPVPRSVARPKLLWAAGGLLVVLALALGLTRVLPSLLRGSGQAPTATDAVLAASTRPVNAPTVETPPQAGAAPDSSTSTKRKSIDQLVAENPRVFSSTAWVLDLIPQSEGVWAATSGGLVRWKADGSSSVFTSADGLPFNLTRALLAMPDGSMWAGGNGAVVHIRPTGDALGEIERYSDTEGVDVGEQPLLMLDTDGSVWLASLYGGSPVQRFDGTFWRSPDIPANDPALQNVETEFSAMIRDKAGALWLALHAGGVLSWDGQAWSHHGPKQGLPEKENITRLLEDARGALWAATGPGGLLRLDRAAGVWQKIEFQRSDAPVYWISELPDKSLWASGNNFIVRSDDGGERWMIVASPEDGLNYPTTVVQDGTGVIWAATGNGMAVYKGEQWQVLRRQGEPLVFQMGQIVPHPDGSLWLLPEYGGIPSVVDPTTGESALPPQWPRTATDVRALAFADGVTWAGAASDGLVRVEDGAVSFFTMADGLPDNRIAALVATTDTLWIGTGQGLVTLDLKSEQITGIVEGTAGQVVDKLTIGPDNVIWAATHWPPEGGNAALYRITGSDRRSWTGDQAPLRQNWAEALRGDEHGGMWVTSDGGLYRWDQKNWVGWDSTQGAPTGGDLWALLAHDGAMWIGGHGRAIDRWHPTDGWRSFRPKGLTSDVTDMYMSMDGVLWLATTDGLLRYGP